MGMSRSMFGQAQPSETTIMRIQTTQSNRNKWPLIASLSITVGLLLFTIPSHAAVDWDEGFEYANNDTMDAVWSSSCPGNGGILFPSTDRAHTGSKSLKEIFRGHQAIGGQSATPGYQSCYKDRNLSAPTTNTLYSRFWIYMDNFTVDATTTKLTLQPAYASDSYTSMWWGMMWGQPQFDVSVQKSTGDTEVLYGGFIPQNQWVCLETRITYATPGQSNGIVQNWINGALGVNRSDVRMDQAGQQSVFRAVRLYTQDGMGTIYYDDYAVSRDARIGCNGSPTPSDTTPPATPSGFTAR